jgi:hypothetical protein
MNSACFRPHFLIRPGFGHNAKFGHIFSHFFFFGHPKKVAEFKTCHNKRKVAVTYATWPGNPAFKQLKHNTCRKKSKVFGNFSGGTLGTFFLMAAARFKNWAKMAGAGCTL